MSKIKFELPKNAEEAKQYVDKLIKEKAEIRVSLKNDQVILLEALKSSFEITKFIYKYPEDKVSLCLHGFNTVNITDIKEIELIAYAEKNVILF
jgi:hypothetical protein